MNEERGNWYLLTGLIIGIVLGLVYSWQIRPLQYSETSPAMLSPEYKDQYRVLIASAYLANHDLVRAEARLSLLNDKDPFQALAGQAQRTLAEEQNAGAARALGVLAVDLGERRNPPKATDAPTATPGPASTGTGDQPSASLPPPSQAAEEQPTAGPEEEDTAPQPTPATAPRAGLVLEERQPVCDPNLLEALVQIQVQDSEGQPLPGMEMVISWQGGQERIFTGLKPELGPGYADFTLLEGVTYSVQAAEGGEEVSGLTVQECQTPGGREYWGGWLLLFRQP